MLQVARIPNQTSTLELPTDPIIFTTKEPKLICNCYEFELGWALALARDIYNQSLQNKWLNCITKKGRMVRNIMADETKTDTPALSPFL